MRNFDARHHYGIELNLPNGTDVSLFGGSQSTAINACLDPSYPVLMTLPFDPYFQNFELFTGQSLLSKSFGIDYYCMLYSNTTTQVSKVRPI